MDSTPTNVPSVPPARPTLLRRFLIPEFLVLAVCGLLLAGSLVGQGAGEIPRPCLIPPPCTPDACG